MQTYLLASLLAIATCSQSAFALETGPPSGPQPVVWTYRALHTGQQYFDQHRAVMAPAATLTFKLPEGLEGTGQPPVVRISWKDGEIALPLAADDTFTLPPATTPVPVDAFVVVNRQFPSGGFRFPSLDVRSPGLPEGTRRMGDYRLRCAIAVQIVTSEVARVRRHLSKAADVGLDPCKPRDGQPTRTLSPFNSVTLVAGERSETIKFPAPTDRYKVPVANPAWPNDTLLHFKLDGVPVK